jgi:low affinity Fe/Cu permease
MVKRKKSKQKALELWSVKVTDWVGTPYSLVVHTLFFIFIFALRFIGVSVDQILLILTTAVSLEAIYLAILIQMTVNRNTASLQSVEDDIEDIQEDVEDLEENVEEISEDLEDIQEDDEKDEQTQEMILKSLEMQIGKMQKDLVRLKSQSVM